MLPKSLFHKIIFALVILIIGSGFSSWNHDSDQWSPQQTIPGYQPDTWPPILVADQNHVVHAFSSQWLEKNGDDPKRVIVYNQWTPDQGWSEPIDILLPQLKDDARLNSVALDQAGVIHLVFASGDNTQVNLYYSKAPARDAGKASAWSEPILIDANVQDPENAAIYVNDPLNLGILFAGTEKGNGMYATYSTDGGERWSHPVSIFSTSNREYLVNNLQINQGGSGDVHAIWNEITDGGQGRGIYYTVLNTGDLRWRAPQRIAEAESGYGTNTPAVIERDGELFAFYNLNGIMMKRSMDGGASWTNPVLIFSRHVGVNGALSLVIDSDNVLHLLFGQRITGNPDIHGMWHSVWQGEKWSEPEAIVSGPAIPDQVGVNAFDPYEARAVVSQGNILLVTWRSDPGLKGNGVWFSYKVLDAPELLGDILPVLQQKPTPELSSESYTPTPTPQNIPSDQNNELLLDGLRNTPEQTGNPMKPMALGIIPTIFLIAGAIVILRKIRR